MRSLYKTLRECVKSMSRALLDRGLMNHHLTQLVRVESFTVAMIEGRSLVLLQFRERTRALVRHRRMVSVVLELNVLQMLRRIRL